MLRTFMPSKPSELAKSISSKCPVFQTSETFLGYFMWSKALARSGNKDVCFIHGVSLAGLGFLPVQVQHSDRPHVHAKRSHAGLLGLGMRRRRFMSDTICLDSRIDSPTMLPSGT